MFGAPVDQTQKFASAHVYKTYNVYTSCVLFLKAKRTAGADKTRLEIIITTII